MSSQKKKKKSCFAFNRFHIYWNIKKIYTLYTFNLANLKVLQFLQYFLPNLFLHPLYEVRDAYASPLIKVKLMLREIN